MIIDRSPTTVVDLVRQRCEDQPDQVAFEFVSVDARRELVSEHLDYAELDRRARAVAVSLLHRGSAGDRVLLMLEPGIDYLTSFFGIMMAGQVPVPAYPMGGARHIGRVESIVANSGATLVMGDLPEIANEASPVQGLGCLHPADAVADGRENDWHAPELQPDSLAFLQYTSGSTGVPKGVMVTQANVMANAASGSATFGLTADDRGVLWLPPYHDLGLIGGVLMPLFAGFPMTLTAPVTFIRNPAVWLRLLSDRSATISASPSFGYDHCVERIAPDDLSGIDLTSWSRALNGAEPVRPEVMDRFVRRFAAVGLRPDVFVPCYGLAESTLVVSGRRPDQPQKTISVDPGALADRLLRLSPDAAGRRLVSSGVPCDDATVRVVDPDTGVESPAGLIGEIWVQSPSVAAGYFGQPQTTAETFAATLPGVGGTFLRTGDLGGFVDGELFVTGRRKDLMIFRGRNVYPQDVESAALESHHALTHARAAAFAVDGAGGPDAGEGLVLVLGVAKPLDQATHDSVDRAVRTAVLADSGVAVTDLVITHKRAIPTTSSGKVQRHAARAAYLSGAIAPSGGREPKGSMAPTSGPVFSQRVLGVLRAAVAEHSGLPLAAIDPGRSVAEFGLDSLKVVTVAEQVSRELGVEISPAFAWEFANLRDAADGIAGMARPDTTQNEPVRNAPAQPSPNRPPAGTAAAEPVAVVGMGCRFPGAAGITQFWNLLTTGTSGITTVPPDRWDADALYD
ncbi:MAG TPA: AMP-binding protein, partial [Microlunatus sp.]|nr:AMP-binding protein [Microlunatus sp.]